MSLLSFCWTPVLIRQKGQRDITLKNPPEQNWSLNFLNARLRHLFEICDWKILFQWNPIRVMTIPALTVMEVSGARRSSGYDIITEKKLENTTLGLPRSGIAPSPSGALCRVIATKAFLTFANLLIKYWRFHNRTFSTELFRVNILRPSPHFKVWNDK